MFSPEQQLEQIIEKINSKFHIFSVGVQPTNRFGLRGFDSEIVSFLSNQEQELIAREYKISNVQDNISDEEFESLRRNSHSILKSSHFRNRLEDVKDTYKTPVIQTYKATKGLTQQCEELGIEGLFTDYKYARDVIEHKAEVRKRLGHLDIFPEFLLISFKELDYSSISSKLGEKFILQTPNSGGGHGTFVITSNDVLQDVISQINEVFKTRDRDTELLEVVLSRFVSGPSTSMSAVTTKWGTFTGNIQYQLIGAKNFEVEDKFEFLGHDFATGFDDFPPGSNIHSKVTKIVKDIGSELYSDGFRGHFGVDMIFVGNEVYVIEINPRFTGTLPSIDLGYLMDETNEKFKGIIRDVNLSFIHCLEFLHDGELSTELVKMIQEKLNSKIDLSHYFVYSEVDARAEFEHSMEAGIYNFNLEHVDKSLDLNNLDTKSIVLIDLPITNTLVFRKSRMARVIYKGKTLDQQKIKVSERFIQLQKDLLSKFKVIPETIEEI